MRDCDWELVTELTTALEAFGYSSDFRLTHFDELISIETVDPEIVPDGYQWKWNESAAQSKGD